MADLTVHLDGLRALAARSGASADILACGPGEVPVGPAHQPTSGAVSAVQTAVDGMANRLAARAAATAVKVENAATSFGEHEHGSAAQIAATRSTIYL
ncbi:hypothetical protein [[Mycobacterium] wendilense]|uniref:PE family protein n=1 Tax=[Mycobacterium] wendilense TaxID=3064284 RepID=A0ABM9M8U6_9MYCO|nr:hypothetical protein [Mycolicibacterium sp. MU0050]CAJ1579251.1 hypothetical protein MU0050_000414 [Mycolicibacterium sp. MU0050]